MKKIVLLCLIALFSIWLNGQNIKQIGTNGIAEDEPPFGIHIPHERSVSLFTHSELGNGSNLWYISSLGFYVSTTNPNCYPIKIYLKTQTSTTLSTTNWETYFTGATLVYNGTACFPDTCWKTFDIADFAYSGTSNQLLVLCQTDWGGTIGASSTPGFYYYTNNATSRHEQWNFYERADCDSVIDNHRPNIQITYTVLTGVIPPSGFMATSVSPSEIDLIWKKNSANNNVMVAFNTTNTFGTPSGTYIAGSSISGGGTVLYNGSGTSYAHTGLGSDSTYYYMAWSVQSSPLAYSQGTGFSAITFCGNTCMYPYTTDFQNPTFPPDCWSLAYVPWIRSTSANGYGTGAASAMANFFQLPNGNIVDLISPPLDLTSMPYPVLKFDYAYATDATHLVDSLQLWTSNDNGTSYTRLISWAGGLNQPLNTGGASAGSFIPLSNQWETMRYALPSGTNRIKLRGISSYGNNLYLDNITFYDTACTNASVPYSEGFDHYTVPTTGCYKVTNDNSDSFFWGTSQNYPESAPNSIYIGHNATLPMDDWFFTPALSLTGGVAYVVSFNYRSGDISLCEKLELKFGTSQTSGGMTGGQIWNNTAIQTTTYQQGGATFTPSGPGPFYVGWHGYSIANMSGIFVDDIHIDLANVTWTGANSESWSDPLNWTPNVIPNEFQIVTIPSGTPHDPTVNNTGLACKQLTVNNGVIMTLSAGSGLTIKGNLTVEHGATMNNDGTITINGNMVIQY